MLKKSFLRHRRTLHMRIQIDKKRDSLLTDYAVGMLKDFYMRPEEKSPQEAYARAATAWSTYKGDTDWAMAQRLYDAVSRKWFMFASPVLSNAPSGDSKGKGLPISCFLTYVPDTLEGLISHSSAWPVMKLSLQLRSPCSLDTQLLCTNLYAQNLIHVW